MSNEGWLVYNPVPLTVNHRKEVGMGTDDLQEQLAQTLEQIDCLWTRLSFLETEYEKLQLEIKQSNYKLADVTDKYYELSSHFDEVTEMLQDDSY